MMSCGNVDGRLVKDLLQTSNTRWLGTKVFSEDCKFTKKYFAAEFIRDRMWRVMHFMRWYYALDKG